jgi:hypothetical protein
MDYALMFPGRFLKAADFLGKTVTLTIRAVRTEELPQDGGGNKVKGIVGFAETKKELVLNRTNAECLRALWGRETDAWIGQRVSFYPAIWNGEPAIRVRGAPHLTEPMNVEIKLPKRKPIHQQLLPTGKGKPNGKAAAQPESPPEESSSEAAESDEVVDPVTGEVF